MNALEEKISKAEEIIKREKEDLLLILENDPDDFAGKADFLSFFEEDAKYRIYDLNLPAEYEDKYLNRIIEIYGPYSEDKPNKEDKYYDNDIYKHKYK